MRKLICIVAVILVSCAHGASVLWDGLQLTKFDLGNGDAEYVLRWIGVGHASSGISGVCSLQVRMELIAFDNVDYYCITSYDDDPTVTGVTANWLQASADDIADASTTRNKKYYFNHCHLDHETGWQNRNIYCDPDASFYLMFAVGSTDDYNNNIPNPNCLYGWAHLEIGGSGDIELLGSAIGLEGQSMIVGAIPEPSSALLLLLGFAGLALRRKERRGEVS